MKKTLVTLLVVALVLGTFGTVSFAAETEMTPIPDAPALEQQYVHMQADGTVKTPGKEDSANSNGNYHRGIEVVCSGTGSSCPTSHCPHTNISYNNGYFSRESWQNLGVGETVAKSFASYSTGSTANDVGTSRYCFHRAAWNLANSVELAFEKLGSENTTKVTADTGYLMLHNNSVVLSASYASFGFGLVSGNQVGCNDMKDDYLYVAVVLEGDDTNGWKSYLQFLNTRHTPTTIGWTSGGQYRQLEISEYVKKDTGFDIKVLSNLDTDTYSIYINNRPVVVSCLADTTSCPSVGGVNFATTMVKPWEAKFATTSCYPMTEADANQFMQAAWERAFNNENYVEFKKSYSSDTLTGIPLFTAWGGSDLAQWAPEQGHFYEKRWESEHVDKGFNTKCILSHEGLEGFGLYDKTDVGQSYARYYLRATNMEDYDYDKLDFLMLKGNPTVDELNGTISGSYIAAGGLGMKRIPRVVTASYTKSGDYETVYDAKVTEGLNGVYSGDISEIDIPEVTNKKLAHYVWGGFDRLTPLYGETILQDFTE